MSSNTKEIRDKAGMVKEGEKESDFTTEGILKKTGANSAPLDYSNNKKDYMPGYKVVGQSVPVLEENKMIMKGDKSAMKSGDEVLPEGLEANLK